MDVLPRKTEKILKLIKENDNQYNMFSFRSSSDDPNWERIQVLMGKSYILEQPADMGPPTYFISPLGETYLQDVEEVRKENRRKWFMDNLFGLLAFIVSLVSLAISLS